MSLEYAALHCHADTSMLDGRARHEEIVEKAVEDGYAAVALTDHDEVNGQIGMQKLCQKAGIKFIPGTEARWLWESTEASKANKTSGYDASHIILLAENNIGLKNMWTLSSLAYEPENFYMKPQLNPTLLKQYASGLWASDGCGLTRFAKYADEGNEDAALQEWSVLLDIFGDRFYSELHTFQALKPDDRELTPDEVTLNLKIRNMNQLKVRFAVEMGVPLVVVNDSHYAQEKDWEQHRLVWAMGKKHNKGDQVDQLAHAADWMMNTDEIIYYMSLHGIDEAITTEAIKNTAWIADQCTAEIKPTISMPRLYETDEEDSKAFQKACQEGLKRFVGDRETPEGIESYQERLDREMALITDKGMAGYFNVVADYMKVARDGTYVKWVDPGAKPSPCICGPGRGSGGGSLVNYVLGITSLDPLAHELTFERFINPDRPDYPDIDVDFQKSHRKGLMAYMGKKYGEDKVVAIGTKSRSGPAKTLQDLCIAKGVPFKDSVAMSKLIKKVDFSDDHDYEEDPDYEPPSWSEVVEVLGGDLAEWVDKGYGWLFDLVEDMVGLCRQPGVHAAGIAMATEPFMGIVPTRRKGGKIENPIATQFDMNEVAWLGGVKMDFLSNKGLDVLAMARELIYERHGVWIDYDGFGNGIPEGCTNVVTMGPEQYDDPFIWEQIDLGRTAGIFQINTPSGTQQAMKFKPRGLKDLADLVAINRPGVLRVPGLLKHYLARRHGEEEIEYDHPLLENITGHTMGILVYQEDLVECAKQLAGFTPGQGETLRKGIGKKIKEILDDLHPAFIDGCMANPEFVNCREGTRATAEKIWASLQAAGAYAFNKAHSVGYAMQAVWEIWTKAYYFDEFITGCLAFHLTKQQEFIRECRRMNRPILPPDINKSGERFTLTDDGIRYGLVDIKGVGDAVMPEILSTRPYLDFPDFLERTTKNGGWKKGIGDSLVKIGAFDWTGMDRQDMLEMLYRHRRSHQAPVMWSKMTADEKDADMALQRRKKPGDYPRYDFSNDDVVMAMEEDLVGTFITKDPMAPYLNMIDNVCIRHPSDMDDFEAGERFVIGGQVTRLHPHTQRNGEQMCFITVRWAEEDFEFLAFASAWGPTKALFKVGAPVACEVIKLKGGGANLSTVERLDWIE